MATDDSFADVQQTQNDQPMTIEQARRELAGALEGAAHEHKGNPDQLVKPGDRGYSIELRLNGETIPLGGQDVSELPAGEFQSFIDRERPRIEAGEYDDAIERALAQPGPGKALTRVRAID